MKKLVTNAVLSRTMSSLRCPLGWAENAKAKLFAFFLAAALAGGMSVGAEEVPWQFTGNTNRVAASSAPASATAVAAASASAKTQYAGVFDSRGRDMRLSNAGNLKSTPATGAVILVR